MMLLMGWGDDDAGWDLPLAPEAGLSTRRW
jgi:hypothetical protein